MALFAEAAVESWEKAGYYNSLELGYSNERIIATGRLHDQPGPHMANFSGLDDDQPMGSSAWPGYATHPMKVEHCDSPGLRYYVAPSARNSISGSSSCGATSSHVESPGYSPSLSPQTVGGVCDAWYPHYLPYGPARPIVEHVEALHPQHCVTMQEILKHGGDYNDTALAYQEGGAVQSGFDDFCEDTSNHAGLDAFDPVDHVMDSMDEPDEHSQPTSPEASTSPPSVMSSLLPTIRRRRVVVQPAISRAPSKSRRGTKRRTKAAKSTAQAEHLPAVDRAYPCLLAVYGCPSTFGSKNEWKRHINTQHMRMDFWRCDKCRPTSAYPKNSRAGPSLTRPRFNDFNRKDLFIQHIRRMHSPSVVSTSPNSSTKSASKQSKRRLSSEFTSLQDQELRNMADRCCIRTRLPPRASECLFCAETFTGPGKWDERLEHIGHHFECLRKGEEQKTGGTTDHTKWRADPPVEKWMLAEGIIERTKGGDGRQLQLVTG